MRLRIRVMVFGEVARLGGQASGKRQDEVASDE